MYLAKQMSNCITNKYNILSHTRINNATAVQSNILKETLLSRRNNPLMYNGELLTYRLYSFILLTALQECGCVKD
jgi:hypothetical protein